MLRQHLPVTISAMLFASITLCPLSFLRKQESGCRQLDSCFLRNDTYRWDVNSRMLKGHPPAPFKGGFVLFHPPLQRGIVLSHHPLKRELVRYYFFICPVSFVLLIYLKEYSASLVCFAPLEVSRLENSEKQSTENGSDRNRS